MACARIFMIALIVHHRLLDGVDYHLRISHASTTGFVAVREEQQQQRQKRRATDGDGDGDGGGVRDPKDQRSAHDWITTSRSTYFVLAVARNSARISRSAS
jgi:hypothetical protein